MSFCLPTFLQKLADPNIKTVLLCGCGGGFDFVHSLVLYPELKRLQKSIIIGSYSFGNPNDIGGDAPVIFHQGHALAKEVTAHNIADPTYGPEVHMCSYLDSKYRDQQPHSIYAYCARAFTVPTLTQFYQQLINIHKIDAIVLVDGGSDSLMVGNEEGLGDPIEDTVSIKAVASLPKLKCKLLISMGLGADRYNHISDSASLRAVAELTAAGGFLGAFSLEPKSMGFVFYRNCIEHIYARQTFRSIISGSIIAATEGYYGNKKVPEILQNRTKRENLFFWPPMSILWAFDVDKVAERSLIADWIEYCTTPLECYQTIKQKRLELVEGVLKVENFPDHETMRGMGRLFDY